MNAEVEQVRKNAEFAATNCDEKEIVDDEEKRGGRANGEAEGTDASEGGNGDEDGYITDRMELSHEPSEDAVNSLPYYKFFCFRLEKMWKKKREKQAHKRWKEKERLEYVLPRKMINDLNGGTLFPYLRILLPDQDSRRQFHVKEKKIAEAYCKVLAFGKGTKSYQMLMNFTDPQKVPFDIAGDLSLVVEYVLKQRLPKDQHSSINLKKINRYLDEIANLRAYANKGGTGRRAHHNHEWRKKSQNGNDNGGNDDGSKEKQTDASLRADWLRRVMNDKLSPLEHKWLVRILQKKMEFGLGYVTVLKHISPYAMELWNAHNNLQRICTILADPAYADNRRAMEEFRNKHAEGETSIWAPQMQPAEIGNVLSPMISIRSSFEKLMTQTQAHHRAHLKKFYPSASKGPRPLSLMFPALSAEVKLDGERMIVHIKSGRVTMHTRRSRWFSELYAPVLGPPLRRSLSKYPNVDVILDGEIESWDNVGKTLVPFGENRTVAGCRRAYLNHNGMIDPIDSEKVHDENDETVMRTTKDFYKDTSLSREEMVERGEQFWLKFRAFDILYVAGPDRQTLFENCGLNTDETDASGSIINLPLMKRKQILYEIITEQENEVEVCPTVVIRCNGDAVLGEDYFSAINPTTELGHSAMFLDSTQVVIQKKLDDLENLDKVRRNGRTDNEISKSRAEAMERFYTKVVEDYKLEGLVVKDLASPYLFGARKFWWKFKPDYETGEAVDIDAVILGAKFATGLRNGGTPSSFILGVVDKFDKNCFMTFDSVNAGSTTRENMEEILKYTGFKKGGEEPMELGKWFREENYGLPSFISKRSLQRNSTEDFGGWAFNKARHYPDIWIDPEDSIVLTIKGAEIVVSEEYSVGLTVRFPRITKVRIDSVDGDEKKASETSTDEEIWRLFDETRSKRLDADSMNGSTYQPEAEIFNFRRGRRFLTPEEYSKRSTKRKTKMACSPSRKVPKVDVRESNVLEGLTFCVLEGLYSFDPSSFDGRVAQEQGWIHEAKRVKTEEDVIEFIKKHGGTFKSEVSGIPKEYIIGGSKDDARVKTQISGLEHGKSLVNSAKKKAERVLAVIAKYHDGILKWSFVYSLVHQLRNGIGKHTDDGYFMPEPHQYLVRVSRKDSISEALFAIDRPISIDEMEHVLATPKVPRASPWQFKGSVDLPENERWVLSSKYTSLWPYKEGTADGNFSQAGKAVVVYPHLFLNGFGFCGEKDVLDEVLSCTRSKRWDNIVLYSDEIASTLPLLSMMGGMVTPHLHCGVTHVLCLLKTDVECKYEDAEYLDVFVCKEDGRRLLEYLEQQSRKHDVKFISPNWIRKKLKFDSSP